MRLASIASIILLHVALVPVFFSGVATPVTLVVAAVVWTALLGFPAVLFPLISVIVVSDSILFGAFQFTSLYFILVAYSVSFFMKRTLLGERSGVGFLVLALFAAGATGGYIVFHQLVVRGLGLGFSLAKIGADILLALCLFVLLVPWLRWFESVIRTLRQDTLFAIK